MMAACAKAKRRDGRGCASDIRAHLSSLPKKETFSAAGVAGEIGRDGVQVQHAFVDFERRGEIVKARSGLFRYIGVDNPRGDRSSIKPRLFRAMHVSSHFSAREITVLADSTRNYTDKVVRELLKTGEIEITGVRKGLRGQHERLFRLRNKDAFFLKHLKGKAKA